MWYIFINAHLTDIFVEKIPIMTELLYFVTYIFLIIEKTLNIGLCEKFRIIVGSQIVGKI